MSNIRDESRLSSAVEKLFFSEISSGMNNNVSDAGTAWKLSIDVVTRNKRGLTLQLARLSNESFNRLFRIAMKSSLEWSLDPKWFRQKGIGYEDLETMGDNELNDLLRGYALNLSLGNKLGIVWVADEEEVQSSGYRSLEEVIGRLGLDNCIEESSVVTYTYKREEIPSDLKTPSALDAIDHYRFKPVPQGQSGLTKPLTNGMKGLGEAVHGSCEISDFEIEVKKTK